MASIERTAYPRFRKRLSEQELHACARGRRIEAALRALPTDHPPYPGRFDRPAERQGQVQPFTDRRRVLDTFARVAL